MIVFIKEFITNIEKKITSENTTITSKLVLGVILYLMLCGGSFAYLILDLPYPYIPIIAEHMLIPLSMILSSPYGVVASIFTLYTFWYIDNHSFGFDAYWYSKANVFVYYVILLASITLISGFIGIYLGEIPITITVGSILTVCYIVTLLGGYEINKVISIATIKDFQNKLAKHDIKYEDAFYMDRKDGIDTSDTEIEEDPDSIEGAIKQADAEETKEELNPLFKEGFWTYITNLLPLCSITFVVYTIFIWLTDPKSAINQIEFTIFIILPAMSILLFYIDSLFTKYIQNR